MPPFRDRRGFTIVELLVTVTIVSIVMTTAVQATIMIARGQGPRAIVADVQGEGRRGLSLVQADLREASLGASTGIVWTEVNGNRTAVPAVQIFDNVGGGGFLDVKPGTDVLLIVRARSRPSGGVSAKVVGDVYATNVPFTVTGLSEPGGDQLSPGTFALVGSYDEAVWVPVQNADAGTMTITPGLATSLLPGTDKMIAAGSPVRHARAFLWFVNNRDELVRVELTVPRAPADTDARAIDIVARGVENLQVGCALETMNGVGASPAPGRSAWAAGRASRRPTPRSGSSAP
jgi:prepilin-type N-terminal cleavage/methylation domain-containing protein